MTRIGLILAGAIRMSSGQADDAGSTVFLLVRRCSTYAGLDVQTQATLYNDQSRTLPAGDRSKMRGWSFPLGRWFGVDVRIHAFFLLLTGPCMLGATAAGLDIWRGMMLWILLLAAVAVREIPRVIGTACFGLQIRNILLLPTGGLYAYANPESTERAASPKVQPTMAMIGPLSNLLFALI